MSQLKLSNPVKFLPLTPFPKKTMNYVDDNWHHATLLYNGLIPVSYEEKHNSFDYDDIEIFYIIKKYGIRPPNWMQFQSDLNDDDLYVLSCKLSNK